ncbi:MAG: sugar transferase [Candidatus Aminicenantes bacterium]|nr:sugar transferase [Candidatus Aminicenantes bacterium]
MNIDSKRLFDIIISIIGLILSLPLMMCLALFIKKEDRGPVFYRANRVGKNGELFNIYKFRTMVVDADKKGGPSASDDDPRITKIGKVLRKYKLDESPQLINVLRGEMSIVGPRPEVPQEVEIYTDEEKRILSVKPGITDYASIHFNNEGEILKGSSNPHEAYRKMIRPTKLRLALQYVDDHSFLIDLNIIIKTILIIIKTRTTKGSANVD